EAPCTGAGTSRSNGLDVKTRKARNITDRAPCTATAEVLSPNGRPRAVASTAPNPVSTRHHRTRLPSWLPQAPATRYSSGLSVWELKATLATEKSDVTKAAIRTAKAAATARAEARAAP